VTEVSSLDAAQGDDALPLTTDQICKLSESERIREGEREREREREKERTMKAQVETQLACCCSATKFDSFETHERKVERREGSDYNNCGLRRSERVVKVKVKGDRQYSNECRSSTRRVLMQQIEHRSSE
jgi:hypothetical protein